MVITLGAAPTIVSRFDLVNKRLASPVHYDNATWAGLTLKAMTQFHAACMAV